MASFSLPADPTGKEMSIVSREFLQILESKQAVVSMKELIEEVEAVIICP
jgi:hypothetical protein